jgi:adenosylcobinamide kinase/adenosylcobinamide-phosphate guanylyltransferase
VRMLGTGSADGWPNPWCDCQSCEWARAEPHRQRGHTSVLLDDTLLVDLGPDVPRAASRAGVSLRDVRTVLLTHAHPDHTGPAALLWRQWAGRMGPLQIAGPAPALDACRDWVGPEQDITWTELAAGGKARLASGHELVALPARHAEDGSGPALLYAIGGVLIGWDTAAPLPEEVHAAGPYDLALLECTNGDGPPVGQHHGLADLAASVRELRRRGSVTEGHRIIATHLGHRNGVGLAARLSQLGVELHPDGALVRGARTVLVTGGARSGKSRFAESLVSGPVTYVATGGSGSGDAEWALRVQRHRERRPADWRTLETLDLSAELTGPMVLVDCLTLWLARSSWSDQGEVLTPDVDGLLTALREATGTVVLVTNEVGSGIVPDTPAARLFADALGELNARVAQECDEVWHCVAGIPTRLR